MRILSSLPNDKDFFNVYAPLADSITKAGVFAQLVSAATEFGIVYTGVSQSLQPLRLGWWESVIAGAVALVATLTIEVGLRKTFPKAIDSILYKRYQGLHLPITIFVWLLVVVLMATSGLLSYRNSSVIVEDMTPEAEQQTTSAADSTYQAETASFAASFRADSLMIESTYLNKLAATAAAFDGKLKAKDEKLRGYESREARTGSSYASRKDRVRQERADLEAQKVEELAILTAALSDELRAAKKDYQASTANALKSRTIATDEVKAENEKAEAEREATVSGYGGGLALFTVVCLFLFSVSVILDRIYRKGAGIEESVQIGAYQFRPGVFLEWWAAIGERIRYKLHSKITAFANDTPAAPLPAQPGAVYDLAEALQNVTFKLELDTASEEDERVIYLNAKEPEPEEPGQRRQIGFKNTNTADNSCDLYSTLNTNDDNTKHEHETVDLREAKQRLKLYKKRLGGHQQKAIKQEQKSGKICKRTADAIENNKGWVSHYETLINNLQKPAQ